MTNNLKLGIALAVVGVIAAFFIGHTLGTPNVSGGIGVGAPGTTLPIENYVPAILYNGGYYSALGITTTSDLSVGGTASITGSATFATSTITLLTVGAQGTQLSRINAGFCNLHTAATSISATSTLTTDCQAGSGTATALQGVTAGDVVNVTLATTSPTTFQGLSILSASASSTAGYITVKLFNGTGAAYTLAAAATSSLNYIVFDR